MQAGESCRQIRLGRKADFLENVTGLSFERDGIVVGFNGPLRHVVRMQQRTVGPSTSLLASS